MQPSAPLHNNGWSACLVPTTEEYSRRLADTDRSLARQVRELLALKCDYVPDSCGCSRAKFLLAKIVLERPSPN